MTFIAVASDAPEAPNHRRALSLRPEVHAAWEGLNGAIKSAGDLRRYELATVAAALQLRSSYCSLAHGRILAEQFVGAEAVEDIARGRRPAGLDDADVAVMDLARKVVVDATSVSQRDVDRLRDLGLTDEQVLDVVLAAAARCFFSKVLDAVGAQADAAFSQLDPSLRDVLTVGRPIADA